MKPLEWLKDKFEYMTDDERASFRLGVGILTLVLFVMLMAQCSAARASSLTAQDQAGNSVTLTDQSCQIKSPWFANWHSGTMTYQGKLLEICWTMRGTNVVVIDSDGEITPIPLRVFHNAVES